MNNTTTPYSASKLKLIEMIEQLRQLGKERFEIGQQINTNSNSQFFDVPQKFDPELDKKLRGEEEAKKAEHDALSKKIGNAKFFVAALLAATRVASGNERSQWVSEAVGRIKDRVIELVQDLDNLPDIGDSEHFDIDFATDVVSLGKVHMAALDRGLDK